MNSLRYFSKSIFWSPLLLSMVAMFALPNWFQTESENTVSEQHIIHNDVQFPEISSLELPYFMQFEQSVVIEVKPQAVQIYPFLVKTYRLYLTTIPPIRAGPTSHC